MLNQYKMKIKKNRKKITMIETTIYMELIKFLKKPIFNFFSLTVHFFRNLTHWAFYSSCQLSDWIETSFLKLVTWIFISCLCFFGWLKKSLSNFFTWNKESLSQFLKWFRKSIFLVLDKNSTVAFIEIETFFSRKIEKAKKIITREINIYIAAKRREIRFIWKLTRVAVPSLIAKMEYRSQRNCVKFRRVMKIYIRNFLLFFDSYFIFTLVLVYFAFHFLIGDYGYWTY